jgi:hypothetical protein
MNKEMENVDKMQNIHTAELLDWARMGPNDQGWPNWGEVRLNVRERETFFKGGGR